MFAKTWKKERFRPVKDFLSFTAILDDKGRILIPAPIRKHLKIKFGSLVIALVRPDYKIFKDGEKDER